jgi:hypothetical protein
LKKRYSFVGVIKARTVPNAVFLEIFRLWGYIHTLFMLFIRVVNSIVVIRWFFYSQTLPTE